jgi:hypothetical protein
MEGMTRSTVKIAQNPLEYQVNTSRDGQVLGERLQH